MNGLNIPGFDDFLADMGADRTQRWIDDALKEVQREIGISFDLTNPDDTKRFVTATFALNQRATVLMLRDYHAWLCKQLGERSLRLL